MLAKRNRTVELTHEIAQLTQDYEKLAKEQKERILTLRDQNRDLSAKLQECLQQKQAVADTLLRAEQTGKQLIEAAKQRSDQIITEARKQEQASVQRLAQHRAALNTLAEQCADILAAIEAELKQPPALFTLDKQAL